MLLSRMAVLLAGACAAWSADLTGRWYVEHQFPAGNRREVTLALQPQGGRLTGQLETTTRRANLVEGKATGSEFSALADFNWDGVRERLPVTGRLQDDALQVEMQGWPRGPMQKFTLKRVSTEPTLPQLSVIPVPPIRKVPGNGLAKTPPMGWNSWNRFGCRIDDRMIREMADVLVSNGMREAGYVYVNIDDCWQDGRDPQGNIRADTKRFPDMKALATYVHSKGLKLGIYSSPGPKTCAGYEGSYGHEEQDARTYAAWRMDYLKYDWCSASRFYSYDQMHAVYQKMGAALVKAGRPILYSLCQYGLADVGKWGPAVGGNTWRTTGDIGNSWESVSEIGFDKQAGLERFARPGHWNDPDMLEIGNGHLSADESRVHMSLWSLLAAPLLAGNDLRSMDAETRAILTQREVIAINQDQLGKQGKRLRKQGEQEIWTKPLADKSVAVGLFNRGKEPASIKVAWAELGLSSQPRHVRDVWAQQDRSTAEPFYNATVPPHGVVLLRVR